MTCELRNIEKEPKPIYCMSKYTSTSYTGMLPVTATYFKHEKDKNIDIVLACRKNGVSGQFHESPYFSGTWKQNKRVPAVFLQVSMLLYM